MSLLRAHWIVIGGAGLLAVMLPVRLLSGGPEPAALPPIPAPTSVDFPTSGGLAYALTAPPFTSGRTPAPDDDATAFEAEEAPAQPAAPPALVGLVVATSGHAVALARGASGETLTLARGESIDGWVVAGIGRDRATFERDGAQHIARLDFTNRTEGSAAALPTAVPTAASPPSQTEAPRLQSDRNP